ncbi:MAG: lipopolysaccharide biosynthesis protein [Deltaproteobacteria bacterium]|nr:lipopolysaccharide biosynthesis protein [Deltaproteobacteria bacterium]
MEHRLAKSVFWIVWSRGVLQVISFISTLVITRLLSPQEFGLIALTSFWIGTVALLSEMGLGDTIVQFRDLEDGELNVCFWLALGVAITGYLGLYIAAPLIASWLTVPALAKVLRVAGFSLPLTAIATVPDSLLRRGLKLDKISQAEILSTIAVIPVVLGMAWAGAGVWALVAGLLLKPMIQGLATFWFVQWWPGWQLGSKRMGVLLNFSLTTLGARICWSMYQQTDTLVLGKIAGEVAVGTYSVAKELATLPLSKVAMVLNQLAFPVMAEAQTNREALRNSLLRSIRLLTWATFPLCTGLLLVASDFVNVALTAKWQSATLVLQMLCVYALFRSFDVLLPPLLIARYRTKLLLIFNLITLGIMPLAFLVGALWSGPLGTAAAWTIVYPLVRIKLVHEALHEAGISWGLFWEQLRPPTTATLVMAAAVWAVRWHLLSYGDSFAFTRLILLILTGMTSYGAVFLAIGGPTRKEFQQVAGWMLRPGHVRSAHL